MVRHDQGEPNCGGWPTPERSLTWSPLKIQQEAGQDGFVQGEAYLIKNDVLIIKPTPYFFEEVILIL
jgi:hypothetical protein